MPKYNVWVTLVSEEPVECDDEGEALDYILNMIENRDGLEISSHEIIIEEVEL